ncbi:hypothetical protein RvY_17158-1 [Ramazzottius varieornatus]|uniref:Uncharacterized protein n=1 Tax=Ramazzottius varieornatus TaxID=947166 RepID=A0A1D1W155_RAMVA|nr:hypothetical protein RvY_17158-1 [Ramazzottius varieornatus]
MDASKTQTVCSIPITAKITLIQHAWTTSAGMVSVNATATRALFPSLLRKTIFQKWKCVLVPLLKKCTRKTEKTDCREDYLKCTAEDARSIGHCTCIAKIKNKYYKNSKNNIRCETTEAPTTTTKLTTTTTPTTTTTTIRKTTVTNTRTTTTARRTVAPTKPITTTTTTTSTTSTTTTLPSTTTTTTTTTTTRTPTTTTPSTISTTADPLDCSWQGPDHCERKVARNSRCSGVPGVPGQCYCNENDKWFPDVKNIESDSLKKQLRCARPLNLSCLEDADCNGPGRPHNIQSLSCLVTSPDGRGTCGCPEGSKDSPTGYQPDADRIRCQCDRENYWFENVKKRSRYLECFRTEDYFRLFWQTLDT